MNEQLSARRPLKSRTTTWAKALTQLMLRLGFRPNGVSVLSIGCAALVPLAVGLMGSCSISDGWLWLLAALGIQLRLLCNLMDGLLAIEGKLKSAAGDLFNEFPDRVSDVLVLASLGYASHSAAGMALGWLASCGALMTACVRMHGASLKGKHDFSGPMAKPHRMALATLMCVFLAGATFLGWGSSVGQTIPWVLGAMVAGLVITLWRRLRNLAALLNTVES